MGKGFRCSPLLEVPLLVPLVLRTAPHQREHPEPLAHLVVLAVQAVLAVLAPLVDLAVLAAQAALVLLAPLVALVVQALQVVLAVLVPQGGPWLRRWERQLSLHRLLLHGVLSQKS